MLKVRVIPTLLYRDFGLVKGVAFDSRRAVGSPMQAIKVYELREVDELVLFDVTATLGGREPDYALIDELADDCFMPLTVGGGVRDVTHIRRLLEVGADKVAVGTGAIESPEVIDEGARRFGSQCIVAVIDVGRGAHGRPSVRTRSGTVDTARDPIDLAREVESRGAGELLVQSVDRDGTMTGYDIETIAAVSDAVSIPVIASGGAGNAVHMAAAILDGHAAAVAAASVFHYTQLTPHEVKQHLSSVGIPVRCSPGEPIPRP